MPYERDHYTLEAAALAGWLFFATIAAGTAFWVALGALAIRALCW